MRGRKRSLLKCFRSGFRIIYRRREKHFFFIFLFLYENVRRTRRNIGRSIVVFWIFLTNNRGNLCHLYRYKIVNIVLRDDASRKTGACARKSQKKCIHLYIIIKKSRVGPKKKKNEFPRKFLHLQSRAILLRKTSRNKTLRYFVFFICISASLFWIRSVKNLHLHCCFFFSFPLCIYYLRSGRSFISDSYFPVR